MTVTHLVTWTSARIVPLTCEQKGALSGGPPARPLLWVGGPLGGLAEGPRWLLSAARTQAHARSSIESAFTPPSPCRHDHALLLRNFALPDGKWVTGALHTH